MENETDIKQLRDMLLKKLMVGRIDTDSLDKIPDLFEMDEIAALRVPSLDWPDSLPAVDPAIRKEIADSFKNAVETRKDSDEVAGQRAQLPKIEMPPEPELSPEEARVRDLAMSLGSMLSQHYTQHDPVHKTDVETRIRDLLTAPPGERLPNVEAENIANLIADERLKNEVRRACVWDLHESMTHLSKADMAKLADGVVYEGFEDIGLDSTLGPLMPDFKARVEKLIDEKLSSDPPVPNDYDRVVADLASRENSDFELTETLGEALFFGVPDDAARLRAMRTEQINGLRDGTLREDMRTQVKELFAAFSHVEVAALLKAKERLPDSLPDLDASNRAKIAKSLLVLFSRIEGALESAPALKQSRSLFRDRARDLGLKIDKGPSHGPEL